MTLKIGIKPVHAIIIYIYLLLSLACFPKAAVAGYFPSPVMTNRSADFLVNLKITGISASPGDEIAFFDPAGVICGLYVVGAAQEYFPIAVYGDDTSTSAIDEGATAGDILTVKIWHAASSQELSGTKLFLAGGIDLGSYLPSPIPPVWQENAGYVLHIDTATHFPQPTTTAWAGNYIGNVTINGQPASIGSEIAIYDSAGVLAGFARIATPGKFMAAIYGDDPTTTDIDEGAVAGETLIFKVWDHTTGSEYSGDNLYLSPGEALGSFYVAANIPPTWSEDPGYVLDIVASGQGRIGQTIDFAPLPDATYGDPPITLVATGGGSGNPVTFSVTSGPGTISGTTLTINGTGTIVITASQAGNANYNPAPDVQRSLIVAKAAATVSLTPASLNYTYDGTAKSASAATTPAGLLLTFTYNDSATPPINAGNYTVVAAVSDLNYQGSAIGTLFIAKAAQVITISPIGTKTNLDAPFSVSASGGESGNPIVFTVVSGPATIAGNIITLTGTGTVTVKASRAGNDDFEPGETSLSFDVVSSLLPPDLSAISTLNDGAVTANPVLNVAGQIPQASGWASFTVNGVSVKVDSDGSFSHAVRLITGPNTIAISATDSLGQTSTVIRTIILDPTAPHLIIATPVDNSSARNPFVGLGGVINESFEVTINGVKRQSVNLSPGLNTLQITATDQAGKRNSLTRTIFHDGNKPTLAIVGPMQDGLTNKAAYLLRGVVADLTSDVALSLQMDGHIYLPSIRFLGNKGHFEQPLRFSEEKTYEITVTAVSGDESKVSVKRNIIYIKSVPGDMNGNGMVDAADAILALQVMAGLHEPTSELIFRGDVAPLLGGQDSPDGVIDLADVLVLLRTITGSIPEEAVAPAISIDGPSAIMTTAGPVSYTVNYTGADTVTLTDADVILNRTGTADGTVAVSGTENANTRTVIISGITGDGTLGITIAAGTAYDAAGNLAPASGASAVFRVDNTAPAVNAGGDQTVGASFTQTATATDAHALTYNWSMQSGPEGGAASFGSSNALSTTIWATVEGTYVIRLTATDAAGNSIHSDFTLLWDTAAPTTTASPAGGAYGSSQSVTLAANEAATIYYTTDGSDPTESSDLYSAEIPITATTTLKYFARDLAGNSEAIKSQTYTISAVTTAITVIDDDFNDGALDPNWSITPTDASGWAYTEAGTDLQVTDITPSGLPNSGNWATVKLSQQFTPLNDFSVNFRFSWDSIGSRPADEAMQELYIYLYDAAGNAISSAGYNDPWIAYPGQKIASAGANSFNSGISNLPSQGNAALEIKRVGNSITVSWDGTPLVTGTSSSPLSEVALLFKYYYYIATSPDTRRSFFGSESVDFVKVEGTPVPVTVDITPPITTISATPASLTNAATASFTFAADETSTYECLQEGGTWTACTSPITYTELLEGDRTFSVRATDLAGNIETTPPSYSWTIDLTPPTSTAYVFEPAPGTYTDFTVELMADEDAVIYYTMDDSDPTASSTVLTYNPYDPIHIPYATLVCVNYYAVDLAGNAETAVNSECVGGYIPPPPPGDGYIPPGGY